MKVLLIILSLVLGLTPKPQSESMRVLAVGKESKISILGSSNVNTFTLDIKEYRGRDTLVVVQRGQKQSASFRKGVLRIRVNDFKNGNPILTKDFRKIVKAKAYPEVLMTFKSVNVFPCTDNKVLTGTAEIEICLAGVSKNFKINIVSNKVGETVYLIGNAALCFNDFGLTAPENILGFITVNDDLKVSFQLALKDISYQVAKK